MITGTSFVSACMQECVLLLHYAGIAMAGMLLFFLTTNYLN